MLKIVLETGYDELKLEEEGRNNPENMRIRLRKEKLYINEIARLKKTLSDYRAQMMDLEEENRKVYHENTSLKLKINELASAL